MVPKKREPVEPLGEEHPQDLRVLIEAGWSPREGAQKAGVVPKKREPVE